LPNQQIPSHGYASGSLPAVGAVPGVPNFSPEMLNFGLSAGQDLINRQKAKWMPGVSDFWSSLKIYFAVSNSYVLKKVSILLYPMSNKYWGRIAADEVGRYGDEVVTEYCFSPSLNGYVVN
jgi:hypothetical protein